MELKIPDNKSIHCPVILDIRQGLIAMEVKFKPNIKLNKEEEEKVFAVLGCCQLLVFIGMPYFNIDSFKQSKEHTLYQLPYSEQACLTELSNDD